jgi:hypothetical protein
MAESWQSQGEPLVAEYFVVNVMDTHFHVTASERPVTDPSNQPIENHQRVQKITFYSIHGKVSLGVYITQVLPRKVESRGRHLCNKPVLLEPPQVDESNRYHAVNALELLFKKRQQPLSNFLIIPKCKVKDASGKAHFFKEAIVLILRTFGFSKTKKMP